MPEPRNPDTPRGNLGPSSGLTLTAPGISVSIAITGSGGSGVMTAGAMLLDAASRAGLYGLMVRTSGPQIRGGEAAALLRLSRQPVGALDDSFDLLVAMDWQNVRRFADEIPLGAASLIVGDSDEGAAPDVFCASGARSVPIALKKIAKAIPGAWGNMVTLGVAGALAGLPLVALEEALRASWKRSVGIDANLAALHAGIAAVGGIHSVSRLLSSTQPANNAPRWLISGNEAAGFGAIRGGVRFVAGYPTSVSATGSPDPRGFRRVASEAIELATDRRLF